MHFMGKKKLNTKIEKRIKKCIQFIMKYIYMLTFNHELSLAILGNFCELKHYQQSTL